MGTDDTQFIWPWLFLGLVRAARLLVDREYRVERQAQPVPVSRNGRGTLPTLPATSNGHGALARLKLGPDPAGPVRR